MRVRKRSINVDADIAESRVLLNFEELDLGVLDSKHTKISKFFHTIAYCKLGACCEVCMHCTLAMVN